MSGPDETSPITRLRRGLQAGAALAGATAAQAAERDDVVGRAVRAGRTGGRKLAETGAAVGGAVNRGVGRAAGSLTLGEYRDEVDRALAEASEVIAAQAAQIAVLEARLEELERDQGGAGGG